MMHIKDSKKLGIGSIFININASITLILLITIFQYFYIKKMFSQSSIIRLIKISVYKERLYE